MAVQGRNRPRRLASSGAMALFIQNLHRHSLLDIEDCTVPKRFGQRDRRGPHGPNASTGFWPEPTVPDDDDHDGQI